MAGVSSKQIKSKIRSMQSTRQITKAMELVASSKLRGAQERAVSNRRFFETLYTAMQDISAESPGFSSPYLTAGKTGRNLFIVIAGDRGLAGGYNNNVLRFAQSQMDKDDIVIPIGKKAVEFFKRNGFELITEELTSAANIGVGRCYTIANLIAEGFLRGDFGKMTIVYTEINSILTQTPRIKQVLPLKIEKPNEISSQPFSFEGGSEQVFNAIVPEYMGGLIYCSVKESFASEQAARRNAMNAASKNADEMISSLNLEYNRARQAAITQEITEIVAGADR